jgi:SOS-response transcriptional repressors (RecA-mediated autopeptidases)
MPFKDRIKSLRQEKNLTQDDLAKIFNFSRTTISGYESGRNEPSYDILQKISEYFNVSIDFLLDKSNIRNTNLEDAYIPDKVIKLPILGVVRAGEPLYAVQNIIGYSSIDANLVPSGECFYLKVKGDSMNLAHIVEGQLIMIRCQQEVENGEIALVLVDGEDATIKKFYRNDSIVTLVPNSSNPEYQPRIIDLKKETFKVVGKVIGTYINF